MRSPRTSRLGDAALVVGLGAATFMLLGAGPEEQALVSPLVSDLEVSQTASPNPVKIGDQLTYRVTVRNPGPGLATAVTVVDTLPAGVNVLPTTSRACTSAGANLLTCLVGAMASSTVETLDIVVSPTQPGTLTNTVQVSLNELDPIASNNTSTVSVVAQSAGTPRSPAALRAATTPGLSSTTQILLEWDDNSSDETEFRIESKATGTFVDVGAAPANGTSHTVTGLSPGTAYTFRLRARNAQGYSVYTNEASATTDGGVAGACTPDDVTLCLNRGRYRVQALWQTEDGRVGFARAVPVSIDTGYFWFFSSANLELVVKVIDACGFAARYWVFAGGLTDVKVDLLVTDTRTGEVKRYANPQKTAFQPVQDTEGFPGCP